jgi:hypothetical protein
VVRRNGTVKRHNFALQDWVRSLPASVGSVSVGAALE